VSDDRPLAYTDVESRWATPRDRVQMIRLVWRVAASYEGRENRVVRMKVRWLSVKHFFRPSARATTYIWTGGQG
jgi:hypothetical protein